MNSFSEVPDPGAQSESPAPGEWMWFMQLFNQIIYVDFVVLLTIAYFSIFIHFNRSYDKKISKPFFRALILLACLVVSDNVDYFYSQKPVPGAPHPFFIMAGFILRVLLILSAIYIMEQGRLTRKQIILLAIPALINTLVILTSPFHRHVFWIDESNVLHREILSYVPHLVSLIYFCVVIKLAIKRIRRGFVQEGLLYFVSLAGIAVAVVSEIILKTRGVLISAILLMLTFYYLYLHMEHFKRDNLTGALNRLSFFAALDRLHSNSITAFCEIDLNNLKKINDTQGHAAGDRAIVTLANVVQRCLPDNSYLYRMGGDEFAVLFIGRDYESCQKIVELIQQEMENTSYSAAIGMAKWDSRLPFQSIYNLADERMYENKRKMKMAG